MKKNWMLVAVKLGLLASLSGVEAQAQAQGADIFVGYSYERDNFPDFNAGLHGYNLAATLNLTRKVGIEVNLAGHHGNSRPVSQVSPAGAINQKDDIFTYAFGPKLTHAIGPSNNFELYTHFLVGGTHAHGNQQNSGAFGNSSFSQKGNGFTLVVGGGLDWFHGRWGIRILEVDFVRSNINTTFTCSPTCSSGTSPGGASNFRLATGVIWRWGRKEEPSPTKTANKLPHPFSSRRRNGAERGAEGGADRSQLAGHED